jgi:hypothetical protein
VIAGADQGELLSLLTPRTTSRSLFKPLEILPALCQCILPLMSFIINNQEIFQTNLSVHNINTRNKHHLHRPYAHVSCFKKSTFYAGIKIFNRLPPRVTILKNDKAKFKAAVRNYLHAPSVKTDLNLHCIDTGLVPVIASTVLMYS